MKKHLIVLLLLVHQFNYALSHSVTIRILNLSTTAILMQDGGYNKGFFCNTFNHAGNQYIRTGEAAFFTSGPAAGFCGVDGFLDFMCMGEQKPVKIVHISFDNPLIGDNEFHYDAAYPYSIRYLRGGEGSDMKLDFEISGGPGPLQSPPPPLPIDLPTYGSKKITGSITWDAAETGLPPSGNLNQKFLNYLTTAFKVEVLAPRQFVTKRNGSGSQYYNGLNGAFTNFEKLKNVKIVFTDSKDEQRTQTDKIYNQMTSKKRINFYISNLPDKLPLNISINTKNANWDVGKNTPKQPLNQDSRWMVFIHEKSKSATSTDYEVYGAWFYGNGGYSSDLLTPIAIGLLQKNTRKTNLVTFVPIDGNLERRPVAALKKEQSSELPVSGMADDKMQLNRKLSPKMNPLQKVKK